MDKPSDSPMSLESELISRAAYWDYVKTLGIVLAIAGQSIDQWLASEPEYLNVTGSPLDGVLKKAYAKMIAAFCESLLSTVGEHADSQMIEIEKQAERILRQNLLEP